MKQKGWKRCFSSKNCKTLGNCEDCLTKVPVAQLQEQNFVTFICSKVAQGGKSLFSKLLGHARVPVCRMSNWTWHFSTLLIPHLKSYYQIDFGPNSRCYWYSRWGWCAGRVWRYCRAWRQRNMIKNNVILICWRSCQCVYCRGSSQQSIYVFARMLNLVSSFTLYPFNTC